MSAHNLTAIDDKEFEILCCQLLSKELNVRFERFKPGRDSGVDGRYFKQGNTEVILQCKHWARSTVSDLFRTLKDKELPKVKKLNPNRYLIATSLELSRADKKRITIIFDGFIKSESDVLGYEDICDLLDKHPEIFRSQFRLWLSSAEVLSFIENAAILGRSEFLLNEVREKAIKYVKTLNHEMAKAILENFGTTIITGSPGIGKTTLAEQLCLEYVLQDYELCVLSNSIEEAESVYKKEKKQIFYFDDFLGTNYIEALNKNEDSHIVSFITRISRDPDKRFILTSRTVVLNEARVLTDRFINAKLERNEFEIKIESLNKLDRANILHKHIWYSTLSSEFIDQILSERRYSIIINHINFNPRLIQFITDAQRFENLDASKYWVDIQSTLSNPTLIWEQVYESQLDDYSRALLLLVAFNAKPIKEEILRFAFDIFKQEPASVRYHGNSDFTRNSKLVAGSVLNRSVNRKGNVYTLFNPSIADYVIPRTSNDTQLLQSIFFSLNTTSSLSNLANLITNRLVHKDCATKIVEYLVDRKLNVISYEIDYRIELAVLAFKFIQTPSIKCQLSFFLNSLEINAPSLFYRWSSLSEILIEGIKNEFIFSRDTRRFIKAFNGASGIVESDIDGMLELYNRVDFNEQTIFIPVLYRHIIEYWEEAIHQVLGDDDKVPRFYSEDDVELLKERVFAIIEMTLDTYPSFSFSTIDVEQIASNVDLYDLIEQNQKSRHRYPGDSNYAGLQPSNQSDGEELIDELFNMDFPTR
jgi:adenylate kinase family enzyme